MDVSITFTVLNCAYACAVTEMANDYPALVAAEKLLSNSAYEQMASAVESVLTNSVIFVIFVRNAVHICVIGHRRMECRVEHRNHRSVGHNFFTCLGYP